MALVLEIEHLLGVAFAAIGPDRPEPDWPPQPDRVFSALVAAWASRGEDPAERNALEWLEQQDPPVLLATAAHHRPSPTTFVPPNDASSGRQGDRAVMPEGRSRQPRRFPAALPHDPLVRLVWSDVDGSPVSALDAIARDVAYVGHSASLTRCRFVSGPVDTTDSRAARRRVYPGRLRELEARYRAGQRPPAGTDLVPVRAEPPRPPGAFSPDWITFELTDDRAAAERGADPTGRAIDLRAAPLACKALRDAIMSGYGNAGLEVPEWISGHQPGGEPSRAPHLAIAPLAFAGFAHADGRLMGFALIPPHGHDPLNDPDFRAALRAIMTIEDGRHRLHLKLGRAGSLWLTPTLNEAASSLRPERYGEASHCWATVTPLVLDRHLKDGDGPPEIEAIVRAACLRAAGVPVRTVVVNKHSAIEGAPSASPSGRAPAWTGWRVPEKLRSRRLVHAAIVFEAKVQGPLLLGAGRFCGLGLCLPFTPPERRR